MGESNPKGPDVKTQVATAAAAEPTLRQALDHIEHGVVITAPDTGPAFVNAYARRILERRAGLRLGPKGLESTRADDTRALRDAVALAASGALDRSVTFLLARDVGTRPLSVQIPVPPSTAKTEHAAVFVCDPDHRPQPNADLLVRMFALTRSEAGVAALLMQGHTTEQAADALFISVHTARTHLKRILLKTETSRQGELIRLLLVACAQVRIE